MPGAMLKSCDASASGAGGGRFSAAATGWARRIYRVISVSVFCASGDIAAPTAHTSSKPSACACSVASSPARDPSPNRRTTSARAKSKPAASSAASTRRPLAAVLRAA